MTPVVPFDPSRTPAGQVRLSLHDAYSESAIRSFVVKLRELAVVSPETCAARFRALDNTLAPMLDEATPGHETTAAYALSERWGQAEPERVRALHQRAVTLITKVMVLTQRLAKERPAALVVLERLMRDVLKQLHREGAR